MIKKDKTVCDICNKTYGLPNSNLTDKAKFDILYMPKGWFVSKGILINKKLITHICNICIEKFFKSIYIGVNK